MTNPDRAARRPASAGADAPAAPKPLSSPAGGDAPPDAASDTSGVAAAPQAGASAPPTPPSPAEAPSDVPDGGSEPDAAGDAGVRGPDDAAAELADDRAAAAEAGDEVREPGPEDPAVAPPGSAGGGGACPYLAAAGGGWRSLEAVRDHRCGALDPPSVIALDKQRRLCLVGAHVRCPTYLAAREARDEVLATVPEGWAPERRFVRTTPVVMQAAPGRSARSVAIGRQRLVEVAVAALALVVVVLIGARILGGEISRIRVDASPAASSIAGASAPLPGSSGEPSVVGSEAPDATPGASADAGSPAPSAGSAGPDGSAGPAPSASATKITYRVRKGDTLSAIAAKYGVTVSAIVKTNKIKNASNIHVGQVLVIPSPAP